MGASSTAGSAKIYRFPSDRMRADFGEVHFALRIDNHPHIREAYGDAAAGRVQDVICAALDEMVSGRGKAVVHEADQILVSLWNRQALGGRATEPACAKFLQAMSRRVSEHAIQVVGETVHALVSGVWSAAGDDERRPTLAHAVAALARVPSCGEAVSVGAGWAGRYRHDMAMAAELLSALSEGLLTLAAQPVAQIADPNTVLYREALLRRSAAQGQWVSTARFLPALERLGLVRVLDAEGVARTLKMLKADPDVVLGVTVSAQSARLDGWWLQATETLRRRRDIAARLVIAISEACPLPSVAEAATFTARLRELGCQVALNNFGAGHTSVAQLLALRPDIVKVSPLFINRAEFSAAGADALRHILGLARAVAPTVVLGGVESLALAEIAAAAGADWGQGALLGTPALAPASVLRGPLRRQTGTPRRKGA